MKRIQVKLYTEKQLYGREGQGRFFAVWRQGGRRKSHLLGMVTRENAEIRVAAIEEEINGGRGEAPLPADSPPFSEIAEAFVREGLVEQEASGSTVRWYEGNLNVLNRAFGETPIESITSDAIERWYREHVLAPGRARNTGRNYLVTLNKVFLFYCEDRKRNLPNPVAPVRVRFRPRRNKKTAMLKRRGSHAKPIPASSLPTFLEKARALDPALHVACLIGCDAGLRMGEIVALRWRHVFFGKSVDDERRHLHVLENRPEGGGGEAEAPKWGSVGKVQMSRRLWRELKAWRKVRLAEGQTKPDDLVLPPRDHSTYRVGVADAAKKAGLGRVSPKDLRDTYASYLFSLGVNLGYVASQLRHKDPETTAKHYASFMPERYIVPPTLRPGEVPADFIARCAGDIAEAMGESEAAPGAE